MRKFNPYRNIFYYYRGQNQHDKLADKQIEDNTTKALINTLELSDISLLHFFISLLDIPFTPNQEPTYDLQVAEVLSRPDALIKMGKTNIYIESKVQAILEIPQIMNHLQSIGKSYIIIITPRESDLGIINSVNMPQIRFITWEKIYIAFNDYYLKRKKEHNDLILNQFLKYLESIDMAPFNGFQKEDFDAFLYVEDDPKKEVRTIVKNKFGKFLNELHKSVSNIPDYKGLKVEVGNLQKESRSIWGTLSDSGKSKVNVPHFNFLINRNGFHIGFIVEGKNPATKFYKNIEANPKQFVAILKKLKGFNIQLQNRIYIRPRKYKNVAVATLRCGKDITDDDLNYIIQKAGRYKLILTLCNVLIPRDYSILNSKEFVSAAIKYLNLLKPLYEFSQKKQ